jgi:PPE-repeat protein
VIAANRALLMALVATNFFGQNTPAIAATEAQYAEMWAQDAVAMYVYAGSSAAATALTPFSPPHQNTDPGGSASQAAAVSQATSTSAGNVQSTVSSVPQALSAASTGTPAQSDLLDFLDNLSNLLTVVLGPATNAAFFAAVLPADILSGPVDLPIGYVGFGTGLSTDENVSGFAGIVPWPNTGPGPVTPFAAPLSNLPPGTVPAPTVSAGLGEANTVGALSVPRGWTVEAPEVRPAALTLAISGPGAAAAPAAEVASANTFNQMGMAGMAGQAMAGPPVADADQDSGKPVTHARLTGRSPGAADGAEVEASPAPRSVVTGVAAAIREIAKLRDQGRLSEEEYKQQKKRLLEISIRHRPLG